MGSIGRLKEKEYPSQAPHPFVQIFKIWPPGRAAGGKIKISKPETKPYFIYQGEL